MRRYSLILLTLCVAFAAGLELAARYWLPRIRSIDARFDRELGRAGQLRPVAGQPVPILIVGNSLMQKAISFPLLNDKLAPEYAGTRFVVEDTDYFDWYYGLSRLFREGARPKAVVLVLSARQLVAQDVRGDIFAHLLMDRHDLLSVKQSLATDNTVASGLLFANFSRFYGFRSEVHKWFLVRVLPDFPALAAKLRPPPAPLASDDQIDNEVTERLRKLAGLCSQYGAQFIMVVPPSTAAHDGSGAVQSAGSHSGVPVLVPFQPQQLPLKLFYTDRFHLNILGAKIFTEALSTELRQVLHGDAVVQSAESNQVPRNSGLSVSPSQPSQ